MAIPTMKGARGRRFARRLKKICIEALQYITAQELSGDFDNFTEEQVYKHLESVLQSFTYNFLKGTKHENPKAPPIGETLFVRYKARLREAQKSEEDRKARVAPEIQIDFALFEKGCLASTEEETLEEIRRKIAQSCGVPKETLFSKEPATSATQIAEAQASLFETQRRYSYLPHKAPDKCQGVSE